MRRWLLLHKPAILRHRRPIRDALIRATPEIYPRIVPQRGPVGTVFTLHYGTFEGTAPITSERRLTQAGINVSSAIVYDAETGAYTFTSTAPGSLVLTETPRNPAGLGVAMTARSVVGEGTITTSPDGTDTETFPDGTVIVTRPDGTIEITYPGGGSSTNQPDGTIVVREPDGTIITDEPDGTQAVEQPDGTVTVREPDGTVIVREPDGTTTTEEPDGTVIVREPDGTEVVTQPDGTVTTEEPDGTTTVREPDGTTIVTRPDGSETVTAPGGTPLPARPRRGDAPTVTPLDGPVGTDFTFFPGTYTGEGPITVERTLTQDGVDVTDQMVGNTFRSTATGILIYTERPRNAGGYGTRQSVAAATGFIEPYAWRAPIGTPDRDPVGTVFTFQIGAYAGTQPIAVARTLTQDGVDVTDQMIVDDTVNPPTRTFIGSQMGLLVYTETPSNTAGPGEPQSVTVEVTDIPVVGTPNRIEPGQGFVGTNYRLVYAIFEGTQPIRVIRTLTQNGIDVTDQIVGGRFTATELGQLVLTERPINEVDEGFEATTTAEVVVPTPVTNVAPPRISPSSGPAGTVFTLSCGTYEGSPPIGVTWRLTQAGVDVTDQIVGNTFTATVTGGWLVLTETPSNPAGVGEPQTATAELIAYSTFRSLYLMDEGSGAIIRPTTTPGFGTLAADGIISGAGASRVAGPALSFVHQQNGIVALDQVEHQFDADTLVGILVKRNPSSSTAQQAIVSAGTSTTTGLFRMIFDDSKQIIPYVHDDTGAQVFGYSFDLTDDVNWMLVTMLLKPQEAILRINGVENVKLTPARPRKLLPYDTPGLKVSLGAQMNSTGSPVNTLGGMIAAYDHVTGVDAGAFTEQMEANLRAIAAARGFQIGKPVLHRRTFPLTETSGNFLPVKENPNDGNVVMTYGSGVTRLGTTGPGIRFDGSANAWARIANGGIPAPDWFGEDMVITTLIRPTAEKAANSIATATGLSAPIFLAKYAGKDLVVQTYDAYTTNFFTTTAANALALGEWALVTMVIKNRETIIRVNGVERARTAHGQRRRNTGTAVNAPLSSITTAVPYFVGSGATAASSPAATLPFTGDMALYDHYNGSDADNRIAILEANARAVAQERGITLPAAP